MLGYLVDKLHLLALFSPFFLLVLPKNLIKPYLKWFILVLALTPMHWVFLDNKCFLTVLGEKLGLYKKSNTTSPFSETNLKWIYKPIMDQIGWKWDNNGIDKMSTLHILINFMIVWFLTFF